MNKENKINEIVNKVVDKVIKENINSYSLQDIEELMEYLYIKPSLSGLNVDLYVDDGGSYIRNEHCLLVFISNGINNKQSFIPISVERQPKILDKTIEIKLSMSELNKVFRFISKYRSLLSKLANDEINQITFINLLKTNNLKEKKKKSSLLNEMATLKPKDSNLPMVIWLDQNNLFQGHAPRIKFQASKEQRTTRDFSTMTLTKPPVIENLPKKCDISNKDIEKLYNFVSKNFDLLLSLSRGEIDYFEDFLPNMIKSE